MCIRLFNYVNSSTRPNKYYVLSFIYIYLPTNWERDVQQSDLSKLPDSQIPVIRAPNPILDAIAEDRLEKAKGLFLPSVPLSVAKRAQEAATATGVTLLLLVGLVVKLTGKPVVRIGPGAMAQAGLSEGQVKRAVSGLVEAGLIRVTSAPGKRREITLLDAEYLAWLRAA